MLTNLKQNIILNYFSNTYLDTSLIFFNNVFCNNDRKFSFNAQKY